VIRAGLDRLPAPPAQLGESPCWDPAEAALYWVDIPACRVHRLDDHGRLASWDVRGLASALVLRRSGGLVVAAGDVFLALDPRTGTTERLASVDHGRPGVRLNDGACDASGRMYIGSMAIDESPGAGALYRLDPDHSVHRLLAGVSISNGIGWSPGGDVMYYVDSLTRQVDLFDYDPATGAITGRRALAVLDGTGCVPDGLAVDAEGGVWVAVWGGGAVHRYSPAGELTEVIEVPADHVSCCAFGGPDLRTLYITTAAGPGESGGSLFATRPGVAGHPVHPYAG
jgi:sugar lactone lactonase YvrE